MKDQFKGPVDLVNPESPAERGKLERKQRKAAKELGEQGGGSDSKLNPVKHSSSKKQSPTKGLTDKCDDSIKLQTRGLSAEERSSANLLRSPLKSPQKSSVKSSKKSRKAKDQLNESMESDK